MQGLDVVDPVAWREMVGMTIVRGLELRARSGATLSVSGIDAGRLPALRGATAAPIAVAGFHDLPLGVANGACVVQPGVDVIAIILDVDDEDDELAWAFAHEVGHAIDHLDGGWPGPADDGVVEASANWLGRWLLRHPTASLAKATAALRRAKRDEAVRGADGRWRFAPAQPPPVRTLALSDEAPPRARFRVVVQREADTAPQAAYARTLAGVGDQIDRLRADRSAGRLLAVSVEARTPTGWVGTTRLER